MNILGNRKIYRLMIYIVAIISIILLSIYLPEKIIIMLIGTVLTILVFRYIYISDERLLFAAIFAAILSNFLRQYISISSYLPQLFLLVIVIKIFDNIVIKKKQFKINKVIGITVVLMVLLDMVTVCFSQLNIGSVLFCYALLRRYAFLITLVFVFNSDINIKTVDKLSKILTGFVVLNMVYILFQFLSGIRGDYLNGLFGYKANGIVLQSLSIILVLYICNYESGIIKRFKTISTVGLLSLYVVYCTIAEVKFGYIVLPIIFILNLMDSKRKLYNAVLIGVIVVALNIGYVNLVKLYPNMDFANTKYLESYLTGSYNNTNTINRFGYMETFRKTVLTDDTKLLIGNGLGSANEGISTEALTGPLNKEFGFMQINWFSIPYMIVENGIVGLILFISIYIYILFKSLKDWVIKRDRLSIVVNMITVISIVFLFYNNQMTNIYSMIFLVWFYISVYLKESIASKSVKENLLNGKETIRD